MSTIADNDRYFIDVHNEGDMSISPEERGQATIDLGYMADGGGKLTPAVVAELAKTAGLVPSHKMRDTFPLMGMVCSERVDAATSDLPDDPKTWTDEERESVRSAANELLKYADAH
jgi:hypothetical protein